MGDMREVYDDMKEHSRDKKASNLENARVLFEKHNIDKEEKNNGNHWIVTDLAGKLIDYYPTTGKWIYRKGKSGRGVMNLLRAMRVIKTKETK